MRSNSMFSHWWSRPQEHTFSKGSHGRDRPQRRTQTLALEPLEGRIVPSFSNPRTYAAGSTPAAIVSGSLRNNGILDLVAANYDQPSTTSNSTISVYLGNGDGTFRTQRTYGVGINPAGVALGDIDNDGR